MSSGNATITTNLRHQEEETPEHRLTETQTYSKPCVKQPLSKRSKIGLQDQLSLNAGQKYCRMLQREHSAILSTFIKLPFVIKIFVLSIFEWLFDTGFTLQARIQEDICSDMQKKFLHKIVNIFLPIGLNMCFGCSKEPSY